MNNQNDAACFFAPIKNPKLNTGLELKVRKTKVINQLREGKREFGLLVAKEISLEKLCSYLPTTLPFGLSDLSGNLKKFEKSLVKIT